MSDKDIRNQLIKSGKMRPTNETPRKSHDNRQALASRKAELCRKQS